jgi:hypothetical protein
MLIIISRLICKDIIFCAFFVSYFSFIFIIMCNFCLIYLVLNDSFDSLAEI